MREAFPVQVSGQGETLVDVFFEAGQASAAGKSRSGPGREEMRRSPNSSSLSLILSKDALDVRQIGSDFTRYRFAGMVGLKTLQDQFVGPEAI